MSKTPEPDTEKLDAEKLYETIAKEKNTTKFFYQFVTAVIAAVSSRTTIVNGMSSNDQQSLISSLLLLGNKKLFNDDESNKKWVSKAFSDTVTVSNVSETVLDFMSLVQSTSATKGKIPAKVKHQFVLDAVSNLLKTAPLDDKERQIILKSLDGLIKTFALIKQGALRPVTTTVATVVAVSTHCCLPLCKPQSK